MFLEDLTFVCWADGSRQVGTSHLRSQYAKRIVLMSSLACGLRLPSVTMYPVQRLHTSEAMRDLTTRDTIDSRNDVSRERSALCWYCTSAGYTRGRR